MKPDVRSSTDIDSNQKNNKEDPKLFNYVNYLRYLFLQQNQI